MTKDTTLDDVMESVDKAVKALSLANLALGMKLEQTSDGRAALSESRQCSQELLQTVYRWVAHGKQQGKRYSLTDEDKK